MQPADMIAIRDVVARQFASASWTPDNPADWSAFAADFLPGAPLYPAARPAQFQTVEAFIERMRGLASASLPSLTERLLDLQIRGTAKIATAIAVCEIAENDAKPNRNVELMLLVKTEGVWKIAAQCWDAESPDDPVLHSMNFV